MNQWAFVVAAYLVVIGGTAGLLFWALAACRRAETQAERIGRPR